MRSEAGAEQRIGERRKKRDKAKQSKAKQRVSIHLGRLVKRSGGCRAEVERLGGAATPTCSPSEPQSHTSSRGIKSCSAEMSRRVNRLRGALLNHPVFPRVAMLKNEFGVQCFVVRLSINILSCWLCSCFWYVVFYDLRCSM